VSCRAPGRVNLIGEHTDYSGGLVLPVAIQLGITLTYEPAEEIALEAPGGERYIAAVERELADLGRPQIGLVGAVDSDLPQGAGLGSSGALEVVVALALCAVAEFDVEPLELALACQRAERRAVGVPTGILDQAASLLGRAGHALLLDCGSLEYRWVGLPVSSGSS
jgi:galactokinase